MGAMANAQTAPQRTSGTLLHFDFNRGTQWPEPLSDALPDTPIDVTPSVESSAVGTIDVAGLTTPSGGLLFKAEVGDVPPDWAALFGSGVLNVSNTESDLRKLTLAFSLSASAARPIGVRIESFDNKKNRTGGLETTIYPAAPDFYQRYALDLSTFKPFGAGRFQPTGSGVRFSFVLQAPAWPINATHEIRLDNLHYASPAYYVSPQGNDQNDGRTEKTAFATPQQALDAANAGDIVLVMEGTYTRPATNSPDDGVAAFRRAGQPDAWITLKNYPGQSPTFSTADSWNIVKIGRGSKATSSTEPALAYLEVRGLHLRGEGESAREKYADLIGKPNPQTNGNGLRVEGRYENQTMHHIRLADNFVEYAAGHGIMTYDADWLYVENNIARNNCWVSFWEPSGISLFGGRDFDGTRNVYKTLARGNQASGNRCFVASVSAGKIRNGNGILIDANNENPQRSYGGRLLIQNNLSFNNGGVGIQMWGSHRLDIVNNTVYYNGTSPEMKWGQIATTFCDDVRLFNNIVVAQDDRPVNTWFRSPETRNTNIVRSHNIYFGGDYAAVMGENDVVVDPRFVQPSADPEKADFRLQPDSPARNRGRWDTFVPIIDLGGRLRPLVDKPDLGAIAQ